ncbi:MAG: pantetheine-phosphate adenylyltransferase [Thiomicrorhabdus sp.]|nr:pantetheine-phosphate adenylyltransferase [Thiomicrorhabdus sp.]
MSIIAVYPGTFDPITAGHTDLIKRAARFYDRLVIAVADNRNKNTLFTLEERIALVKKVLQDFDNVEVRGFDTLLVDFVHEVGGNVLLRGLRAVSDFEYEFQMTGMNAKLNPNIETVFLMAADRWQFVSSAFVKEIASMGGAVEEFVTPQVAQLLQKKFIK